MKQQKEERSGGGGVGCGVVVLWCCGVVVRTGAQSWSSPRVVVLWLMSSPSTLRILSYTLLMIGTVADTFLDLDM